jgi:putative holliday junction resolvase
MIKTVLAFDFGLKNIGVAVGNLVTHTTTELTPLKARDGIPNWDDIQNIIDEWQPQQLLVGLPLNMDDTNALLAPHARKFANRLKEKFQLPVAQMDERLSSVAAKQEALDRGHKINYKTNPVDSIAARLILESWMNEEIRKQ